MCEKDKITLEFPILQTERLVLRELAAADAAVLFQYWSDWEVTRYFSLEPFKTVDEAAGMIAILKGLFADNEGIRWAVTAKENGKVLGTCGFHNVKPEHHRAELGYELSSEYWGQGLMKEALTAILRYGFGEADYNRIEAFVNMGNDRSTGILTRLGFRLDGVLREYEFSRGRFIDQYCYSLLKREYPKLL